ncbi:MAG: alpha/beta fold hydrolase [Thermoanaerobaculia bacterium]
MSRNARILLALSGAVLVALLAFGLWFYFNPLAAFASLGRRTLLKKGFVKKTIAAPSGTLAYFVGGAGGTVVILHGAGDQAGTFSQIAPALMAHHRVLIPDLPGHGESGPATGPIRLTAIVEGVEVLLAKESPSDPVVLVGNSLGAWAACIVARRNPGRVSQLVLVNGGPLRGENRSLTLTPKNREQARNMVNALRDPASPRIPDFVLDDIVRQAARGPLGRLDVADMEANLLDGKIRDVFVPAEVLWGVSDRLLTLEYAKKLVRELPAARLTELPACGHIPQVECPTDFLAALNKALDAPLPVPGTSAPPGGKT